MPRVLMWTLAVMQAVLCARLLVTHKMNLVTSALVSTQKRPNIMRNMCSFAIQQYALLSPPGAK